jgi:hypothetical protein
MRNGKIDITNQRLEIEMKKFAIAAAAVLAAGTAAFCRRASRKEHVSGDRNRFCRQGSG